MQQIRTRRYSPPIMPIWRQGKMYICIGIRPVYGGSWGSGRLRSFYNRKKKLTARCDGQKQPFLGKGKKHLLRRRNSFKCPPNRSGDNWTEVQAHLTAVALQSFYISIKRLWNFPQYFKSGHGPKVSIVLTGVWAGPLFRCGCYDLFLPERAICCCQSVSGYVKRIKNCGSRSTDV